MNPEQQRSILAIALFVAFADGAKHDREREEIRRIAESLGGEPEGVPRAGLRPARRGDSSPRNQVHPISRVSIRTSCSSASAWGPPPPRCKTPVSAS